MVDTDVPVLNEAGEVVDRLRAVKGHDFLVQFQNFVGQEFQLGVGDTGRVVGSRFVPEYFLDELGGRIEEEKQQAEAGLDDGLNLSSEIRQASIPVRQIREAARVDISGNKIVEATQTATQTAKENPVETANKASGVVTVLLFLVSVVGIGLAYLRRGN